VDAVGKPFLVAQQVEVFAHPAAGNLTQVNDVIGFKDQQKESFVLPGKKTGRGATFGTSATPGNVWRSKAN